MEHASWSCTKGVLGRGSSSKEPRGVKVHDTKTPVCGKRLKRMKMRLVWKTER